MPTAAQVAEKFITRVNDGNRSVMTWIGNLDHALGGLERQTLTVLAARPSMGKTALSLQIARNVAQNGGKALVFSLEMSDVSLWARMACPVVDVDWRDVRSGRISDIKRGELIRSAKDLVERYGDRLLISDTWHTTETIWRTVASERPDLVVVDHLRLVKDEAQSEVKRLGMITERLKDMSKAYGCATLLNAQLSRKVEERSDKRPILADLRDSGEIEENADIIIMVYRDDYYTYNTGANSETELLIRKFRDGPANIQVNLMFNKRSEWFEERSK